MKNKNQLKLKLLAIFTIICIGLCCSAYNIYSNIVPNPFKVG